MRSEKVAGRLTMRSGRHLWGDRISCSATIPGKRGVGNRVLFPGVGLRQIAGIQGFPDIFPAARISGSRVWVQCTVRSVRAGVFFGGRRRWRHVYDRICGDRWKRRHACAERWKATGLHVKDIPRQEVTDIRMDPERAMLLYGVKRF